MKEVFLARRIEAGGAHRDLVLKRFTAGAVEPAFEESSRKQARIAAKLHHPQIVEVLDCECGRDCCCLLVEYIDGRTLAEARRAGKAVGRPLKPPLLGQIAAEVCRGLHHAHTTGVVHGHLHPDSIMISHDGEVKILGFGFKPMSLLRTTEDGWRTSYAAPEQFQERKTDARSDQWSLAAVVWEMIAGRPLFFGGSDYELLEDIQRGDISPAGKLNPDVPQEMDAVLLRALQRDPGQRYPGTDAFGRALGGFFTNRLDGPADIVLASTMRGLQLGAAALSSQDSPPSETLGLGGKALRSAQAALGPDWLLGELPYEWGDLVFLIATHRREAHRLLAAVELNWPLGTDSARAVLDQLLDMNPPPGVIPLKQIIARKSLWDHTVLVYPLPTSRPLEQIFPLAQPAPARDAIRFGIGFCRLASEIHAALGSCGDLDPSCVWVHPADPGQVEIVGLGIAGARREGIGDCPDRNYFPCFGNPLACLFWQAPETLRGHKPTAAAEQYFLGLLLYRLLAGTYPLPSKGYSDLFERATRPAPALPASLGVPDDLSRVVTRLLEPEPDRRYPRLEDLQRALQDCLESCTRD
ncbi:MAG: protein kinase [Deltaproteobacteria bacterium]|nr:protein kinase [Deltaproteobacteria bacterium]